jgi:lipoprotein-anchoring transpeptidase ErfK/SrfK
VSRTAQIVPAIVVVLLASAAFAAAAGADTGPPSVCVPAAATAPADPAAPAAPLAVVSYPAPSATAVAHRTATLLASADTQGAAAQVAFEIGATTAYGACTATQTLPATTGPQAVSAQIRGLTPGATIHFRVVVTTAAGQVTGSDQSFATVANVTRLAPGTTILGIRVGYLTPGKAQAKVQAAYARPLTFTWHGKRWKATPKQLGAHADVAGAVARALTSGRSSSRPLVVKIDSDRVARYVTYLDRLFSRPARAGSVRLVGRKATLITPQTALAVRDQHMQAAITQALQSTTRTAIELKTTETPPPGTGALSIVVRLGEQSLTLYKDGAVVLKTPVTTGRPALPTPVGSYDIAWRRTPYTFISPWPEGSPYWYPPAHVRWAMFFYDNDFLHDSGEPTSAYGRGSNFGPWASHGCVHVPYSVMQELFTTVPDHTPVIVADA